jgi:hypothetical protein
MLKWFLSFVKVKQPHFCTKDVIVAAQAEIPNGNYSQMLYAEDVL